MGMYAQEQEVGVLISSAIFLYFHKAFGVEIGELLTRHMTLPISPYCSLDFIGQMLRAHICACVPLTETAGLDWAGCQAVCHMSHHTRVEEALENWLLYTKAPTPRTPRHSHGKCHTVGFAVAKPTS